MNKLISIVGTTACGKSSLGIELAKHYGAEIVSADSRQVYKYLNLGTGKVTPEETEDIPHHLIDILELNQPFSMAEFQTLAYGAIDGIISHGKLPIMVGGTGLYTRSVVEGYNLNEAMPDTALRDELSVKSRDELIEILRTYGYEEEIPNDASPRRIIRMIEKLSTGSAVENPSTPRYDVLQLGMTYDREVLYKRIWDRLIMRIDIGMIEEVENVMKLGATSEFLEKLGLEYRYTYRYLSGFYASRDEYINELYREICHFAKRQVTWFKKEKNIIWLDTSGDCLAESIKLVDGFLAGN